MLLFRKITAESSPELEKLGPQIPFNNQVELYSGDQAEEYSLLSEFI